MRTDPCTPSGGTRGTGPLCLSPRAGPCRFVWAWRPAEDGLNEAAGSAGRVEGVCHAWTVIEPHPYEERIEIIFPDCNRDYSQGESRCYL